MEIKGTHKFTAAPQTVWNALHDGAVLAKCIPGAEEVAWRGENAVFARVNVGLGPVKGTYAGEAQVTEHTAPTHMQVGINRASADGTLTVDLAPDGAGTLLSYSANARLSGALAAADNPLTRPFVDQVINQIFSRLEQQIG